MTEKLLKEERLVLRCLSLYGCLQWEQLVKLISYKQEDVAERILVGLKKRQYIEEFDGGYVRLDPKTNPDQRVINAFWVLLEYIGKIAPNAHYAADYPSEIYFMRDNAMYEIISLEENEGYLLSALFLENRYNSSEEEDMMKFIIIVPDPDSIEGCLKSIPDSAIEKGQVLFAVLEYEGENVRPKVQYYKC